MTSKDPNDATHVTRAILIGAATSVLVACGNGDLESVPPLSVTTAAVERVDGYTAARAFVGSVRAGRRTDASFDLAGRVTSVALDDGDAVDAGEALARLETDRLEAGRAELAAAVEGARAALSQAENAARRLERTREIDPDAVGELALENARDSVRSARAELLRVEQQQARVELDIEKSTLRAPFDALVERRHVDPGTVVSPGTPVLTLLEQAAREARIGLSPAAAARLEPGRRYRLLAGGSSREAELARLLPSEDARLRTVEAVFVYVGEGPIPRPGELITVEVELDYADPGFWVPLQALTASVRGLWAVYAVVAEDGLADGATHVLERHEVEVLHERNDRAYVRSTLADGNRIVADGIQRLSPGLAVRVASED